MHNFVVTAQQSPLAENDEKYRTVLNWRVTSQNRGLSNFFFYLIISSFVLRGILQIINTSDLVVKVYFLPEIRSSEEQQVFIQGLKNNQHKLKTLWAITKFLGSTVTQQAEPVEPQLNGCICNDFYYETLLPSYTGQKYIMIQTFPQHLTS